MTPFGMPMNSPHSELQGISLGKKPRGLVSTIHAREGRDCSQPGATRQSFGAPNIDRSKARAGGGLGGQGRRSLRGREFWTGAEVCLAVRSGGLGFVRVYQVAELLGGLEVGDALGGDFYALSGFGVAPDAGVALADAE